MLVSKLPLPEQKDKNGNVVKAQDDNLTFNQKIDSAFKMLKKTD